MSETSRIKQLEKLVAKFNHEFNNSWQDIDRMYLVLEKITNTHADSGTLKKIAKEALYKLTKESKYDSI
mgnify:CR=1 FL=1